MLAASAANLSRFILLLPTPAWKLRCHHLVAHLACTEIETVVII